MKANVQPQPYLGDYDVAVPVVKPQLQLDQLAAADKPQSFRARTAEGKELERLRSNLEARKSSVARVYNATCPFNGCGHVTPVNIDSEMKPRVHTKCGKCGKRFVFFNPKPEEQLQPDSFVHRLLTPRPPTPRANKVVSAV